MYIYIYKYWTRPSSLSVGRIHTSALALKKAAEEYDLDSHSSASYSSLQALYTRLMYQLPAEVKTVIEKEAPKFDTAERTTADDEALF